MQQSPTKVIARVALRNKFSDIVWQLFRCENGRAGEQKKNRNDNKRLHKISLRTIVRPVWFVPPTPVVFDDAITFADSMELKVHATPWRRFYFYGVAMTIYNQQIPLPAYRHVNCASNDVARSEGRRYAESFHSKGFHHLGGTSH